MKEVLVAFARGAKWFCRLARYTRQRSSCNLALATKTNSGASESQVVLHLTGVGQGLQDHPAFCCLWDCPESLPTSLVPGAVIYGKSEAGLDGPDFQILQAVLSAEDAAKLGLPARGWALIGNVV